MNILDEIDMRAALEKKQDADANMKNTVYSQHIGTLLGGRATLVLTFDAEPRFTRDEWDELNVAVKTFVYGKVKV